MTTPIGWLVFFIALYLVIFIHEMGHFLEALRLGVPIKEVTIGFFHLFTLRIKGHPVKIGLIPLGGAVVLRRGDRDIPKWKSFYLILAGPVASLFVGFVLMQAMSFITHGQTGTVLNQSFKEVSACSAPGYLLFVLWIQNVISAAGIPGYVGTVGFLSVLVGVFNLIPVPPLDGGRLVGLLFEKVFGPKFQYVMLAISLVAFVFIVGDIAQSIGQTAVAIAAQKSC